MPEKHVVLWCYDRKLTHTSTTLKDYHCNKLVGLLPGMSIHFPCAQIHISCANHHVKITSSVHWAIQLLGLGELSSVKQVFSGSFININSVRYSRVFFYLLYTVHAPSPHRIQSSELWYKLQCSTVWKLKDSSCICCGYLSLAPLFLSSLLSLYSKWTVQTL